MKPVSARMPDDVLFFAFTVRPKARPLLFIFLAWRSYENNKLFFGHIHARIRFLYRYGLRSGPG